MNPICTDELRLTGEVICVNKYDLTDEDYILHFGEDSFYNNLVKIRLHDLNKDSKDMEYYYRRGNKLFFRTLDENQKSTLVLTDLEFNKSKHTLKIGNKYKFE